MKKQNFKFDDSVLHRLVQILQESMILGIDISDIMKKIEVTPSKDDKTKLVLTDEYVESVKEWHKSLLDNAENLKKQENDSQKLIVTQ
jgi:hypothetical protein